MRRRPGARSVSVRQARRRRRAASSLRRYGARRRSSKPRERSRRAASCSGTRATRGTFLRVGCAAHGLAGAASLEGEDAEVGEGGERGAPGPGDLGCGPDDELGAVFEAFEIGGEGTGGFAGGSDDGDGVTTGHEGFLTASAKSQRERPYPQLSQKRPDWRGMTFIEKRYESHSAEAVAPAGRERRFRGTPLRCQPLYRLKIAGRFPTLFLLIRRLPCGP